MSDAHTITTRQWEQLQAEVVHERTVARRQLAEGHLGTTEYWAGYEAACETVANAMRRIGSGGPPRDIEDIVTE